MESSVFLQTKLHPSQVAFRSLTRARLLRDLDRERGQRLVLITGPAGSGKSTLVADYLAHQPKKVAWLGLGEEDRDPKVFFNYFLEALCQAYPGSVEETRNRYGGATELVDSEILGTFFINEAVKFAEPLSIVLDDYHFVDSVEPINAFFKLLSRRGPTNLTLIMVSREHPDLPLAWLRAKRLLVEVHQENLRFTHAEATELFRDIWGHVLLPDQVHLLIEKTEGWATGLQLVAQAIRNLAPEEVPRYLRDLQGSERSIYEYLATEVFEAQPTRVQDFLLFSSVPDSFNIQLAQELAEDCDAFEMLQHLKTTRLFLIQLDRDGEWFRYHHLFRDFLRRKLQIDRGRKVYDTLHQRTARWLYDHDEVVASIPHFLASGDPQLAAEVLEKVGSELLHRGLRDSISRWLEMLPSPMRRERPGLVVLQAELYDLHGQWSRAVEGYREASEVYRALGSTRELAGVLEKLSLCYIKYGETKILLQTCEDGLRVCPDDNLSLRAMLQAWLGSCLVNSGEDWERGYKLIRSSHQLAFQTQDPRAISWASLTYGFVYHFPQGNFAEALRTLNEGIDFFTRLGWPMVVYQLNMNKALILTISGDTKRGTEVIDDTLLQARRLGHTYVERGLEILRSLCYLETGCLEQCRHTLETIARGEIAAQFKPWFFRNRMLVNCLENNFGQARVDAEEMERSLLLSGAGLYAPECFVSLGFLLAQMGDHGEAEHRLQMNLRLCERAQAKFWEMRTWKLLAWNAQQCNHLEEVPERLERALQLTQENDYAMHWASDPLRISVPLLLFALAHGIEEAIAERLMSRLSHRWLEQLEVAVQCADTAVRKVAVRYLGLIAQDSVKGLLKQISRNDSDSEVRDAAKKALKLPDIGGRLRVNSLGSLRLSVDGELMDHNRLLRPLAQRLLKYFVTYADKNISIDQLIDVFWPEIEPEKGRHNLATQLSVIRRSLGTQILFPRVGDRLRFCGVGEIIVDSVDFERNARNGLKLFREDHVDEALPLLLRAEELYQGDFLSEDLYDDWIELRRQELRQLYDQLLETLGDHFARNGQHDLAVIRYRNLLVSEQLPEAVFRKMFQSFALMGDRQSARREYESFRIRLRDACGVEPQASTRALLESLFSGELQPQLQSPGSGS